MKRRARGYTLMEIVVTMALFGVFLFIIVTLTSEMHRNEKKWPINFFTHPEVGSVLARIRRDVFDSISLLDNFDTYTSSPATLIVYTINQDGTAETVVWDFSKPGEVHRKAYKATLLSSEWMARSVPIFTSSQQPMPTGQVAVRIQAIDKEGKLAIDEIFVPRPHA
ncbi:MAG: prepilin-type N-terminal cleavage/methylation domain-containing protein [Acidobacteriota bacterium]|nr:prepilin-type N-terminal cleavage/methylation domain-containing protein [Acidobacteriota bacterium]